ncbi:AAA family ATPase [Dactylosporangium sp. NBC_01737]|uniref:AAA family ATPase n=1 Tax=Dactylosporangium sp. NBC_01737 TaxID=2975959 RepID=UPI002E15E3BD|nr:AAA family ATPase [Dactylosporangium sp. NBC_01737]
MTRRFAAGRTVVHKEPLGPDAQRRVRHEAAILGRLRGVAGVAQLVEAPRCPGSVVVEDIGGISLAGLAKPLAIDELIGLAVGLARAVAGMHRRGVMHRDITPANIVISRDGAPCLVDFALATSFAEIRPDFTHHSEIVGTLAYLAPEQTGRTGRSVDQRADLYALGATLYELATGEPPFGTGDLLQLTHDQLARVPVPPTEANQAVPGPLSEVIMHLLEKEPDSRYQTADGVAYDLERLRNADADSAATALRVGEHDVPLRLLPPSRLVGRDAEVAALEAAFEEAVVGRRRGVLVSGAPGVGKTALIDELRSVVTGSDGWFVAGKFDQYRRDLEFDAVYQAFCALGRLLLAEPEHELADVRERILQAVGPNAGLMTAVLPEFAALLEVPPDPGDPLTAQVRAQRMAVENLRAVASRKRPMVVFLDDLQWAGRAPLGFVDLVLSEQQIDGLLLVCAYREDDVDAAHPMAALLSRWREQPGVEHLRLAGLPFSSSVAMVAEMLHVDRTTATSLVEAIDPHTSGNPYETVELLNALRREDVLTATAEGWRWDAAAVRAHLGQSDVAGLLAASVDAMPPTSRQMMEAMACLGGRAEMRLLQTATAAPVDVVEQRLASALDDGLLVAEPGARDAVRFRHDRIREVVLRGVDPLRRRTLQLAMARRLAGVPEWFAVAAEQYLPVVDAVDDAAERRVVVGLLRRTADQAALIGDYALVNALLAAALRLIGPDETATLIEVHTGRHAALFSMGRLEEADEEYRTIEGLCTTAFDRVDATVVQARSLTHRNRYTEAIGLGLASLRELGVAMPAADRLPMELDHRLDELYRWLDHTEDVDDLARPDVTEPVLLAASRLINAILPVAYFTAHATFSWLSLEALRVWIEYGPARTLLGPASHAGFAAVAVRGDYAVGYRTLRRFVALGEARGYEPDTSQTRFLLSLQGCWAEPVESSVQAAQRAREGLIAGGDLANAGYTYHSTTVGMLECVPSLDVYVAEMGDALAFLRRTGSAQTLQWLDTYRWLAGLLRGERSVAAGETASFDMYADSPWALFHTHIARAIAAAIFADVVGLVRHTAAAMPLLPAGAGLYATALARLLRGLALAAQARAGHDGEGGGLLTELDDVTKWLAARAVDAPDNFLHLLRLLEAERAWAVGDFRAAGLGFDAARREVAQRRRPWHQALITEHAACFYLAHGFEFAGYNLLLEARREYLAWGATAKVDQLDWAYPTLRPQTDAAAGPHGDQPDDALHQRATVTTGTLDLLGIVSASQALSSQTSIEGLHSRLVRVLTAMTGATGVHLLLWSDDQQLWLLPAPGGGAIPGSVTGHERMVPMSVLRYAQRMREPLVVGDATRDDRFTRDPYFFDVDCCSLLAVPILSRGMLRAVLLLENRLIRGAFTTERLDGVKLIAGQLAVSLDNAQLYAQFRRIADEQTALRRVATLVARGVRADLVFAAVAEEVGALFDADGTAIVRFEPDGETTLMGGSGFEPTQPGWRGKPDPHSAMASVQATGCAARRDVDDPASQSLPETTLPGLCSAVASPILVEGRVWGAMGVGSRRERLPQDAEQRLADFTELIATAIANAESRSELTTSRARIVATADQTRRRIEQDLHDGAQQRLVALALQLRTAQADVPPELGTLAAQLDHAVAGATSAVNELREISRGIHPAILTEGGLRPALRTLARRSPIPVDLNLHAVGRLPEQVEISAYYIIAEALTNATKHAHASAVTVTVEADAIEAADADTVDAVLRVTVSDDGDGGADFARGTGLLGLKDRAEALGGRIVLHSPRGAGTTLHVELPLTATNGGFTTRQLA